MLSLWPPALCAIPHPARFSRPSVTMQPRQLIGSALSPPLPWATLHPCARPLAFQGGQPLADGSPSGSSRKSVHGDGGSDFSRKCGPAVAEKGERKYPLFWLAAHRSGAVRSHAPWAVAVNSQVPLRQQAEPGPLRGGGVQRRATSRLALGRGRALLSERTNSPGM